MRTQHGFVGKVSFLASACVLVGALLAAPSGTAHAAPNNITIHIDGINGIDGSGNWSNLLSYSWGVRQPTSRFEAMSRARSKGASNQLTFTRLVDTTTTSLMQAVANAQTAPTADLTVIPPSATQPVLTYHMENVVFDSVAQAGNTNSNDGAPMESISIDFQSVAISYTPQQEGPPPPPFIWKFPPVDIERELF